MLLGGTQGSQPHILAEQLGSGAFRVLVAMETLLQAPVHGVLSALPGGVMLQGDMRGWGSAGPHARGGGGGVVGCTPGGLLGEERQRRCGAALGVAGRGSRMAPVRFPCTALSSPSLWALGFHSSLHVSSHSPFHTGDSPPYVSFQWDAQHFSDQQLLLPRDLAIPNPRGHLQRG